MARWVLGINSAHADSAAVLVNESGIVAAIAEERINRRKHCSGFPVQAIREVIRVAGISPKDLTDVAVGRDPRANLREKLTFIARNPLSGIARAFNRAKVHDDVADTPDAVAKALGCNVADLNINFHQVEHHLAHAASAYFSSDFEEATAVTLDGAGDFATGMIAHCEGQEIKVLSRSLWPHSAGVFYTSVCQFIGFDRFGEEYKAMGLSAYGNNTFSREMQQLIWFDEKKGIRLDLSYFLHHKMSSSMENHRDDGEITIPQMWSSKFEELFGISRHRDEPYDQRIHDITASMQVRFEEVYLELVRSAVRKTGCRNVVLAGGCALNSVANGRLLQEKVVDRLAFHPAASDDGTGAGAALQVMNKVSGGKRTLPMKNAYLGTEWDDAAIEAALVAAGLPFSRMSREETLASATEALSKGKIMGWFHGREEWGPRALGNRSILCNPGWPGMKKILNSRIKNREHFRPFAPVIREERLNEVFEGAHPVPYMIIVYQVRGEWQERLSAITHEDGSGRVQTVSRDQNTLYYDLLGEFENKTGFPVLLNTSFNENEPVVHTPTEAINCFSRTKMDVLSIGGFWLAKE